MTFCLIWDSKSLSSCKDIELFFLCLYTISLDVFPLSESYMENSSDRYL
jgi:hypothetical protein